MGQVFVWIIHLYLYIYYLGNGETFPGGKIDYILADYGVPVWEAHIDK